LTKGGFLHHTISKFF